MLEIKIICSFIKSILFRLKMSLAKRHHLTSKQTFILFELDKFQEFVPIFQIDGECSLGLSFLIYLNLHVLGIVNCYQIFLGLLVVLVE